MQLLKQQALLATYDPSTMAACRDHAQRQAAQLQQAQEAVQQVNPKYWMSSSRRMRRSGRGARLPEVYAASCTAACSSTCNSGWPLGACSAPHAHTVSRDVDPGYLVLTLD